MNDLPANYAKVLFDVQIDPQQLQKTRELLTQSKELRQALENPLVRKGEKHRVIEKLFPQSIWNFLKVMSDNGDIACIEPMFEAYDVLVYKAQNAISAVFTYVTKPSDEQVRKLKEMICVRYHKKYVDLKLEEDPALIGGFILSVGDSVLDKSFRTSMAKMKRHFTTR